MRLDLFLVSRRKPAPVQPGIEVVNGVVAIVACEPVHGADTGVTIPIR